MQVKIQVKGLPKASKLRHFAAHKLNVALARFAHVVEEARMNLSDINGAERGGVDKLCRVVLKMKNRSVVVIEELGADIAQTIDRVTDRLHQSVARQLTRIAKIDRKGMRQNALALAEA